MSEFYIDIEHGQIVQKRVMRKYFDELVDGSYKITIKKGKRRSNRANRYYWGVVINLVLEGLKDAGFDTVRDAEDAHEVCKALFLKQSEQHGDVKIERVGSSKKLTSVEFEEYIMHITTWAWDYLSVMIPAPGEQKDLEF